MGRFLRQHEGRLMLSAGSVSVAVTLLDTGRTWGLIADFGLWRAGVMAVAIFAVVALAVAAAILVLGWLGRTQARSETKVQQAVDLQSRNQFEFAPGNRAWRQAVSLCEEALSIEPTNRRAAWVLKRLVHLALVMGCREHDTEDYAELPEEYRDLVVYEIPGFTWEDGWYERGELVSVTELPEGFPIWGSDTPGFEWVARRHAAAVPIRPSSVLRRTRRFLVARLGGDSAPRPSWIAGTIAVLLIGVVWFAPENIVGESTVYRVYGSGCEALFGECGNTVNGFSRTDALYATAWALQDRFPRSRTTGEIVGTTSCWEYVEAREGGILIDPHSNQGRFSVEFGWKDPDYEGGFEWFGTSRWIAVPPTGGGDWQIILDGEPMAILHGEGERVGLPDDSSCAEPSRTGASGD